MSQLVRYIFVQLFWAFLFYLLVFTGIIWVTTSIGILNFFIETGQSASAFLEISMLNLPKVLIVSTGVSALAASINVTNRLYNEAEYSVISAAGFNSFQFAQPFIYLGLLAALLSYVATMYLDPVGRQKIQERTSQLAQEYLIELITPGKIINEAETVTMYFGAYSDDGQLSQVFIEERPNDNEVIVYLAERGQLLRDEDGQRLVLFDGSIQQRMIDRASANVVQFESFAFDLDQLGLVPRQLYGSNEIYTGAQARAVLANPAIGRDLERSVKTEYLNRFIVIFQSLVLPLLAMSIMICGKFKRNGILPRILGAILAALMLDLLRGSIWGQARRGQIPYEGMFLPLIVAICVIVLLLSYNDRHFARAQKAVL